jgi:hypothetical protein
LQQKIVEAARKCGEHGGPTTCEETLAKLSMEELKKEVAFLKLTNG